MIDMKEERQFMGNRVYGRQVVDGHVHTELCPHGSGDKTVLMLEKAIDLKIDKICLTEPPCRQGLRTYMAVLKQVMIRECLKRIKSKYI